MDPRRLFALLKMNQLARDNPGGFMDTSSGPQGLVIEYDTAVRIAELVGAPAT